MNALLTDVSLGRLALGVADVQCDKQAHTFSAPQSHIEESQKAAGQVADEEEELVGFCSLGYTRHIFSNVPGGVCLLVTKLNRGMLAMRRVNPFLVEMVPVSVATRRWCTGLR